MDNHDGRCEVCGAWLNDYDQCPNENVPGHDDAEADLDASELASRINPQEC